MRLASYNVENLFDRPAAMNLPRDASEPGTQAIKIAAALNKLFDKPRYSAADIAKIKQLLKDGKLSARNSINRFLTLRVNRGSLLNQRNEVIATGRGDWLGWVELTKEQTDDLAVENTARIIRDVDADIVAVVEAENRPALVRFNKYVIPRVGGTPYPRIMLIDGNDTRGIDVGVMAKDSCEIVAMRSHVDDIDGPFNPLFARDCPEYEFITPSGRRLVLLINHFTSKFGGDNADTKARRTAQAHRVAKIYNRLRSEGKTLVAVLGDFNDIPDSTPLRPLLAQTDLADIATLDGFDDGGRPGTHGNCTASGKLDYILLSPELRALAGDAGINRSGIWGGKNGTLFPHIPEITAERHAASDHAALWVDLDL